MINILKEITLLYVEDDEIIRAVLEKVLARKVKQLLVAQDGEEGYQKFIDHSPDIILTDIKMPKQDGITMSKKIKEINKNIPIIVTSAHSEANYFLEAIELGIDDYLLKPIDRNKLLNSLESNAKVVLYEKEKTKQQKLLQTVVDLQASIIFSIDKNKKRLFANNLFFDYFKNENRSIYDDSSFCEYDDVNQSSIVKLLENVNEQWLDYLFSNKKESFKISINKNNQDIVFLVKAKQIDEKEDEPIMVITLVEL